MSKELQIISEQQIFGKPFKVYGTFENPMLLAQDVAAWIEHSNSREMTKSVDDDEKLLSTILTSGQRREVQMLTENGVYEVLFQSRKPIAKKFKSEVKKILHALRTGKAKLIMTEYQDSIIKTRIKNAQIREALILERLANQYDGTYKQVLHAHATKALTGDYLLPLPQMQEKTYTAEEIGAQLGISANKVGRLANTNNLKVPEYGGWFNDKAKGHSKEVQSFRYYSGVIPVIRELLQH